MEKINYNINKLSNIINTIEEELSKKVNLEQLNYVLKTQGKLNEALTSSSKVCRLYWNSDDDLMNNKYIKWSLQSINTALDVFKWDKNSEIIKILQKGVYRIVVGLIGLEKNEDIVIILNMNNSNNYIDKGNINVIEKYIACVENTEIKISIYKDNNNYDFSEEAFLELKKII